MLVLQDLEPGAEVGGVGVRIVWDPALGQQEDARELGPQLFLGIVEIAKAVALSQGLPVEPLRGARPVRELMKGGPVIVPRCFEGRLWWKMNCVGQTVVEGALGLVMTDPGAAVAQQGLSSLGDLPLLAHTRRMSRNPVDLTSVEDGVNAVEETITAGIWGVVPGFLAGCELGLGELPKFNLCAFFAPSHLPFIFLGLSAGKPARVFV